MLLLVSYFLFLIVKRYRAFVYTAIQIKLLLLLSLGPVLFLVYINDVVNATNYFSIRLFVDDTSLTVACKDLDLLLQPINSELPAIYKWLCSNRLTLNLSKAKYLVFQPRQKVNSNSHPPLKIADQYLEQSYNIKYLGLVIDCFLSWHDHIDHISSKTSKSVNIIYRKTETTCNNPVFDKYLLCTCLPLFKLRLHSVG